MMRMAGEGSSGDNTEGGSVTSTRPPGVATTSGGGLEGAGPFGASRLATGVPGGGARLESRGGGSRLASGGGAAIGSAMMLGNGGS